MDSTKEPIVHFKASLDADTACGVAMNANHVDVWSHRAEDITCEACMNKLVAGGGYEKLKYTDNCIAPKLRFIGSES